MTPKDKRFLDITVTMNRDRTDPLIDNQHVIAILVHRNKIIAVGYNSFDSYKIQRKFKKTPYSFYTHAELHCLKNALKRNLLHIIQKCTMYISRVSGGNRVGLAKPCSGCQKALNYYGIKKVVYTT